MGIVLKYCEDNNVVYKRHREDKCLASAFKNDLILILKNNHCELINFEYYEKIFGNFVIKIRIDKKEFEFITDRGDIYCDGKLLCNYEYRKNENLSTPQKLLELIEKRIHTRGHS